VTVEIGAVHSVRSDILGAYLTAAAASSATTLVVDSVLDFSEDGGQLTLNGVTYTYTAIDPTALTITLATGLTGAAAAQDHVTLTPDARNVSALVMVDHAEDALTVRVPHGLIPYLTEGIRAEGSRETVLFDELNGEFSIVEIVNKQPVLDGTVIDPTTAPHPHDGLPPSTSPTPTVAGSIRQFFLSWDPVTNTDPVTYDVHMSLTAGFTPGPTTLVGSTEGTTFVVQVENPDYTVSYYFRVVARDDDGSAAAGTEVGQTLVAINSPDIAADAIRANNILAGQLTASHLSSTFLQSGEITTGPAGTRRVRVSMDGIQLLAADDSAVVEMPTDLDRPAVFNGQVQTSSLTSLDNLEIRGTNNQQATGSSVTLSAGITQSGTPPTATVSYPTAATGLDNTYYRTVGVDFGSTYAYLTRRFFQQTIIERRDIGGLAGTPLDLYPDFETARGTALCTVTATDYLMVLSDQLDTGTGNPTGNFRVLKINPSPWTSPSIVTQYAWTHDTAVTYYPPNIGRDFTNAAQYVTAEVLANQTQIRFRRWSAADGSLISTVTGASMGTALFNKPDKGIRGCGYGSFGMGVGNMYYAAMNDVVWMFDTSGVYQSTWSFLTNGNQGGFSWNSTTSKFAGYNNDDTLLTTYTDWDRTGSASSTIWSAYTWYDSAGTTHETPMSTQKKFTMPKRAQVTVGAPSLPGAGGVDDPNAVRFFFGGPSSTAPARTAMWDQATEPGTGVLSQTYTTFRLATGGGAVNPPSSNNFPTAAPAKILSSDSTSLVVSGDGSVAAQSLQLRGTDAINRFKMGAVSATTNASGQITVTHSLGATPTVVMVTGTGTPIVRVQAQTSTTFTVECRNSAGGLVVSATATFNWLALA
jgi:hypothetical protein